MGLNLAGIVIDNNFERDLNQLADVLEWAIEEIEEIQFGTALSIFSSDEEDVFNIYFTDSGTIIFTPFEWVMDKFHPTDFNSMCFAYTETSMTYIFSYQDKHSNHREFMEDEGQKQSAFGQPLKIENEYPNASGLIFKLIEDLTGVNFHSIDHRAIAYRCRKLSHKEYMRRDEEQLKKEMGITKNEDDKNIEKYMKEIGLDPKIVETELKKKKRWWVIWK